MKVSQKMRDWATANGLNASASDVDVVKYASQALQSGKLNADAFSDFSRSEGEERLKTIVHSAVTEATKGMSTGSGMTPHQLYQGAGNDGASLGGVSIRVKGEFEKYSTLSYQAKHAKTGMPIHFEGKPVMTPSQLQLAKIGAYARFKSLRDGLNIRPLSEHERALLTQMYHDDTWCGPMVSGSDDWSDNVKMPQHFDVKALLNDSTSGGQYLIPTDFDEAIVTFPLLHSELMPACDLRTTNRDVIEGATVGNPTVTGNQAEGTALTLFTTTGLVGQLSTTMFNAMVGVEIGRDQLSDSPVDVGEILKMNIGQAMLNWLDNQIANGDGTTEPQGIFNASGATAVNSAMGVQGPILLGDIEALMFGIAKQYRNSTYQPAFVCNDSTYRRIRAMPVGPSEATRLLGSDYGSYTILGHKCLIQNDIADSSIAYLGMKAYRLFRRQGFETRFSDQGQTLMLKNTVLIVVRGRWGGKVVNSSALAKMTNAQAYG